MSDYDPGLYNPRTTEYLNSFGLDAKLIGADGWDSVGYWEFQVHDSFSSGGYQRFIDSETGEVDKRWREWPEGFDADELKTRYEKDRHEDWRRH
jgi:hypothetical protein